MESKSLYHSLYVSYVPYSKVGGVFSIPDLLKGKGNEDDLVELYPGIPKSRTRVSVGDLPLVAVGSGAVGPCFALPESLGNRI
jgi:hypothetical protein